MKSLLLAALAMSLSACFGSLPVMQTEVRTAPAACLTDCAPAPLPASPDLKGLASWAKDYMDAYRECHLKHRECVEWQTKGTPQP